MLKMNLRLAVMGMGLLLAAAGLRAEPEAAAGVADYGAGFRAFLTLGMPDLTGAAYGQIGSPEEYESREFFYHIFDVAGLKGNAWKLAADKDKAVGSFMMLSGAVQEIELATGKNEKGAKWQECGLARDLAKAVAYVRKKIEQQTVLKGLDERELTREQLKIWHDSFVKSSYVQGAFFLLAVAAWQNGSQAEANELAAALFELAGDSRKVILGAMNVLANAQLDAVSDKLWRSGDWEAAQGEVATLLERFPVGWGRAALARRYAEQLRKRVEWKEEPLQGEGLSELDQELARELALASPPQDYRSIDSLWFLHIDELPAGEPPPDDPLSRILERGVDSVPLLLALAKDETLTRYFRRHIGEYQLFGDREEALESEEKISIAYIALYRPQSRGELALRLLLGLDNQMDLSFGRRALAGIDEIMTAAETRWREIRDLTPEQKLFYYFENGVGSQRWEALEFLLEVGDEYYEPVENIILKGVAEQTARQRTHRRGYYYDESMFATTYVKKRGEAAADFVERYIAAKREMLKPAGEMADDDAYDPVKIGLAKEEVKLRVLTSKPDLPEAIRRLTKLDNFTDEDKSFVYAMLPRIAATNALPALLQAAVGTQDQAVRTRILHQFSHLAADGFMDAEYDDEGMLSAESRELLLGGANAAAWRELLADQRASELDRQIADLTLMSIERICNIMFYVEWRGNILGETGSEALEMAILRERAEARLAGKPEAELPGLPRAADVSDARQAELLAALVGAEAERVAETCADLTIAETLFLLVELKDNEKLMESLAEQSRRITRMKVDTDKVPPLPEMLAKAKGSKLTAEMVFAMRDYCFDGVKQGKPLLVKLNHAGLGQGLHLEIVARDSAVSGLEASANLKELMSKRKKQPLGYVEGLVETSDFEWCPAIWQLEREGAGEDGDEQDGEQDGDETEELEELLPHLEGQIEEFETVVVGLCEGGEFLNMEMQIVFMGSMAEGDKR